MFRDDARVSFARRVITRPADPDGEDHEPIAEADFDARDSRCRVGAWVALRDSEGAADGGVVVANVSRGVIAEAARRYRLRVIEVTASPGILPARLAARGAETSEDVARRLQSKRGSSRGCGSRDKSERWHARRGR